jgi:hypothetical protein
MAWRPRKRPMVFMLIGSFLVIASTACELLADTMSDFQSFYRTAVADLEAKPLIVDGFWYCGRAVNAARSAHAAASMVEDYCRAKYNQYTGQCSGSDECSQWAQLLASTTTGSAPPPGFSQLITKVATPAELACQAGQTDVSTLSFSDWEFILQQGDDSPCNKAAADKVWRALQDRQKREGKMTLLVKVISVVLPTSLSAAASDENQAAHRADLEIAMAQPASQWPLHLAPGVQTQVTGLITGYKLTGNPAMSPVIFSMKNGELNGPKPDKNYPNRRNKIPHPERH